MAAGATVVCASAAVGLFVTACGSAGSGARDEGPARSGASASATPSTSPHPVGWKVDPVALLMKDPKVGQDIKDDLKPCRTNDYPVDVSYGNLTNGSAPDVLVNILTCGDAVGIGTFAYRVDTRAGHTGTYENIFSSEEPPVYGQIDRGDLIVTQQIYGDAASAYTEGDAVVNPSSEDVITYRWEKGRFVELDRTHTDYSDVLNSTDPSS
jgi:hypothetical protein